MLTYVVTGKREKAPKTVAQIESHTISGKFEDPTFNTFSALNSTCTFDTYYATPVVQPVCSHFYVRTYQYP